MIKLTFFSFCEGIEHLVAVIVDKSCKDCFLVIASFLSLS